MKAKILEKSQEKIWEDFVRNHPLATIHQTAKWGDFQGQHWIVGLFDDERIIAGTLLVKRNLPKGYCWLYAPRGPLATPTEFEALMPVITEIAAKENAIFLRIDPPLAKPVKFKDFHDVKYGFQPQHTIIIDISVSEEEILKQMKPKGRYNIRLAAKKGVTVEQSTDIAGFYKLMSQTTKRDGFSAHDQKFYEKMLQALGENAKLYFAKYNNEVIAGVLNTYFGDTATYYFGASSNSHREFMAPYLLHWEAIKDAKKDGFTKYDLFGIAPAEAKNHPWQGVTEFKKKFGGEEISYQPAQEHAFKKILYSLYRLYKF